VTVLSTEGLILGLNVLTDSSWIVTWITRDHGKLKTVAKAARRPNSPFAGQLDLFHTCTLSYAESRRSELHTLRDARVLRQPCRLRTDYSALKTAGSLAQFLIKSLELEYPDPELYEMCQGYLAALEAGDTEEREKLRKAIWKHLR
jgi:DNA repair protein RecO (recombination protein O)